MLKMGRRPMRIIGGKAQEVKVMGRALHVALETVTPILVHGAASVVTVRETLGGVA